MASRKKGRYKVKDRYFKRAKEEGYRARSAYKLKEIIARYKIVRRGDRVLDLGAAPGSFLQVLSEVVGAEGVVIGVDLKEIEPIEGVETVVADIFEYKGLSGKCGFGTKFPSICAKETKREEGVSGNDTSTSDESPAAKLEKLQSEADFPESPKPEGKFDVITSDLAPQTTGIKFIDDDDSVELNLAALEVVKEHLEDGGRAVFKIFQSNETRRFVDAAKKVFERVHLVRPDAVRKTSKEIYVVCSGFKW